MSENTNYNSRVYDDPAYRIAKGMYLAIGGDPNVTFDSTDAIYEAINGIYAESGGRIAIEPLNMLISSNGPYTFNDEDITGYKPVNIEVEVEQKYTDEFVADLEKTSYNEGYSVGESEGYADGYAEGLDDGAEEQKSLLESITITENGTYNKEDGWNAVTVEVPTSGGGSGGDGLDFESIGWDAAYSKEVNDKFKSDLEYSKQKLEEINNISSVITIKLRDDKNLVFGPEIDFKGGMAGFGSFCDGCTSLLVAPILKNYTSVHTGNMSYMFHSCTSLSVVPHFDTSKIKDMRYTFQKCTSLKTIPQFDTSSVTNMSSMFDGCTSLKTIPQFDTSSVTNMSSMFDGCSSLTTIPQLDTSSVTNMSSMFYNCTSLQIVPQFDTSSVTNMNSMFSGCSSLTTVPLIDASSVTNMNSMFYSCTNLTDVGGLVNLGMQSGLASPPSYSGTFRYSRNITRESMLNIFNGLYDRATAGYSTITLYFDVAVIDRLTADDIAIATNKGWTISE